MPTINVKERPASSFHLFGKWRRFGTFGSTTICLCVVYLLSWCFGRGFTHRRVFTTRESSAHARCFLFVCFSLLSQDATERERLTTSVINKLVVEHPDCTALAHAYALRAKARQELENWEGAIEDAQQVIVGKLLRQRATASSVSICYRVWADSEEGLHHRDQAIAVLEDWQKAQPCFRTKIQREVQDLLLQTP